MGERQQRGNTQSGVATAIMTTPLTLASAVASYDLNLEIPFVFGCKEAKETAVGYTELAFAVFKQGYLLVLLGLFYLSSSTGAGNDKETATLGVARWFLGPYGGGGGGKVERGKELSRRRRGKLGGSGGEMTPGDGGRG